MKTNRIIQFALTAIFASSTLLGQDLHFSMFSETPAFINPALAGVTYNTRVVANYKNQWSSIGSKYETMAVSFEQTIKHKKLKGNYFAIAANIFKDVAGDARLSSLNPNIGLSYIQKITKSMKLSGGVQSGFYFKTLDATNLRMDGHYN